MINICPDCWNGVFLAKKSKKDFFLRNKREKCPYCGKRKYLINGIVAESSELTRIHLTGEKPYRTVTSWEAATLKHALDVLNLKRAKKETYL